MCKWERLVTYRPINLFTNAYLNLYVKRFAYLILAEMRIDSMFFWGYCHCIHCEEEDHIENERTT